MNDFAMKQVLSNEQPEEVPDEEGDNDSDDPCDSEEHDETENDSNDRWNAEIGQKGPAQPPSDTANIISDRPNAKETNAFNKTKEKSIITDNDSESTMNEDE